MNELSPGRHILLQFQRCRAETVGEYFALPVEVGKCSFLLDVGHHGRITHAEAPIGPTTTPAIREHGKKGVFVDDVLPLTQTFRAVLVGRAEAVVGLAAQTDESVTAPNRCGGEGCPSRRSCSSLSRMHRRSQHPVDGTACC